MRKLRYIFLAAILALTSCHNEEINIPDHMTANPGDQKVAITFPVSFPTDGTSTRAMGNKPDLKNIYVVVFGGSGYFNEWVPAEVGTEYATANEVVYKLKVKLSMSDSRLRLHIIANSPVGEPPITGISVNDTEDIVMSKIRSKIDGTNNDAYWQKIILPYGIQAETEITNGVEQYKYDDNHNLIPTVETIKQFTEHHNPIPLVRNFARICLINGTSDVTIDRFCLAYAPTEGPVAPILPNSYQSDVWGAPVTGNSEYKENFFINYQNYSLAEMGEAPFNYGGYSPGDQTFGTYPTSLENMTKWSAPTSTDTVFLYVYERTRPRSGQKATRVIIHAQKAGEDAKYYPLDILDKNDGEPAALLRNFTYILNLTEIAAGTGETTIEKAADATAANVSADPKTQDLNEVSDGTASIAVSYIDTTIIRAGTYSVMYRFLPQISTGVESNNPSTTPTGVTMKFGYNDGNGFKEGVNSANGNAFASDPTIETNSNGSAKLYVRNGNGWAVATTAQINNTSIEKWGRINYTTVGMAGNAFTESYTKVIRVIGIKGNGTQIYRDVQVNLTPKKDMTVECLDKYIEEKAGADETVRIYIPNDLTKSMFPIEFKIQPAAGTLTPRDGDNLPVSSGKSIIPDQETRSAYFFIKTLTRQQYESLPTVQVEGKTLKYFDCLFKSSKATSATTVYVSSEYFNQDDDDFANYTKRYFRNLTFVPESVSIGANVQFSFTMDPVHTGSAVWNDATNIGANNKVLPRTVTISMNGIEPQRDANNQIADEGLVRVSNGVYRYTLKNLNDTHPTLNLVASTTSDNYSITLTTSEITPNPDLYEVASASGEIVKSKITDIHFEDAAGHTITNVLALAGQPVYFCFTYGGTQVPVTFKLNGLEPNNDSHVSGSDTYTYTPTSGGAQKVALKTTTASMDAVSVTDFAVSSDSYNQPTPKTYTLERFLYSFTGGFTNASGSAAVKSVKTKAGEDVYFTLTYESDPVPVTFSLAGLEPASDQTGLEVNGSVYTFTPSGNSKTQIIHFKTTDTNTTCVLSNLAPANNSYVTPDPNEFSLQRKNGYFSVTSTGTYGWSSSNVNPDSNQYYAYQSDNYHVGSSVATMKVTVVGYTEFTVYIRSYGETSYYNYDYDYTVARKIGAGALNSWSYNSAYNDDGTKAYTTSTSGTSIGNYTAVTFTTTDGLTDDETPHTFYIQYGKDGRTDSGDDRGYVLIPKEYNYMPVESVTFNLTNANAVSSNNVTISYSNCDWNNNAVRMGNDTGAATISVPDGYKLISVSLTFTQNAKDLIPSTGSFSRNGNNGEWTPTVDTNTVTLTNTSYGNRPRVSSFTVEYIRTN